MPARDRFHQGGPGTPEAWARWPDRRGVAPPEPLVVMPTPGSVRRRPIQWFPAVPAVAVAPTEWALRRATEIRSEETHAARLWRRAPSGGQPHPTHPRGEMPGTMRTADCLDGPAE